MPLSAVDSVLKQTINHSCQYLGKDLHFEPPDYGAQSINEMG
jgi:hypothetical protein